MQPQIRFQIAFDEADGEGIVFFGNYFRLAHRALEQWLPSRGIPWSSWFASADYAVPLRHVEADYLGPLRPGEELCVEIQVADLGVSSVVFEYSFLVTGQLRAKLKTAHVFVTRKPVAKLAVPESIRSKLV